MFTIGDFSKIAQVTPRQLRFYDQIGLLSPARVEANGHRFYSAKQLTRLNHILVLKGLGFSLERIAAQLRSDPDVAELRAMLRLQQAESEARLREEALRLQQIRARLEQLEDEEARLVNVVVKRVPELPTVSLRDTFASLDEAEAVFGQLIDVISAAPAGVFGPFFGRLLSDAFTEEDLHAELGCLVDRPRAATRTLAAAPHLDLRPDVLPAVEQMATYVVEGPSHTLHLGYGALGAWAERNGYRVAGPSREVVLQLPDGADGPMITEVQFPVSRQVSDAPEST